MRMLSLILALVTPPTLAFGSKGGSPPPPSADSASAPPPPLIPPMLQSPQGAAAADTVRKRAATGRGYGGTIITGGQGLTAPAVTSQKSLLGG